MKPILFPASATSFNNNGLGRLSDAISCDVNETLNGEYYLTMTHPFDGIHAGDIAYGNIIYAQANQKDGPQAFRIAKIQESLEKKKLTITANHISYDLSGYPVSPFTTTGASNAVSGITSHCLVTQPFTINTDLTNTASAFKVENARSIRNCIGGEEGSLLDTFGGELKFNNFTVSLLSARGANNGVSIRYKKNMESFLNVRSVDNAYSGMLSFFDNGQTVVTGGVINSSNASSFPTPKILIYDATSEFNSAPSVADLNTFSTNYISSHNIGQPYVDTVTVSFVPLWQTEEYKHLKEFETVGLGDSVNVIYKGFNTTIKAVEYTFDVLTERYKKMVLGQKKTTLYKTIRQIA